MLAGYNKRHGLHIYLKLMEWQFLRLDNASSKTLKNQLQTDQTATDKPI